MRHFTSTTTTERAASRHSIRFHQQQPRWLSSTSGTESITVRVYYYDDYL